MLRFSTSFTRQKTERQSEHREKFIKKAVEANRIIDEERVTDILQPCRSNPASSIPARKESLAHGLNDVASTPKFVNCFTHRDTPGERQFSLLG